MFIGGGAIAASNGSMLTFKIISDSGYKYQLKWGNSAANSTTLVDTNYHTFIIYDKRMWIASPTIDLTDSSILNIINSVTPDINVSTGVFTSGTEQYITYGQVPVDAQSPKFTYVSSYIGRINNGVITWDVKHIMNNPYYIYDILKLNSGIPISSGSNYYLPLLEYSIYASTHCLDYGYSCLVLEGRLDLQIPFLVNKTPNSGYALSTNHASVYHVDAWSDGYVWSKDVQGNSVYHNLSDSIIEFTSSIWDRSNTNIWKDIARVSATFYDSTSDSTKKRWHVSNLNNLLLRTWLNTDYYGMPFVNVYPNSCDIDERLTLKEVFAYSTNKIGNDFNAVLKYVNDYNIIVI